MFQKLVLFLSFAFCVEREQQQPISDSSDSVSDSYPPLNAVFPVRQLSFWGLGGITSQQILLMLVAWSPYLHNVQTLRIFVRCDEIFIYLNQAKNIAAESNIRFRHIHFINSDGSHFNTWSEQEQNFALNVADSLSSINISQILPFSRLASQILGKTKYIRMNFPETDEIREAMRQSNPKRLKFHFDTELDLSTFVHLEIVDIRIDSTTAPNCWSNVLLKALRTQTIQFVYIRQDYLPISESFIRQVQRFIEPFPRWEMVNLFDYISLTRTI
jgi:hypothetical protein